MSLYNSTAYLSDRVSRSPSRTMYGSNYRAGSSSARRPTKFDDKEIPDYYDEGYGRLTRLQDRQNREVEALCSRMRELEASYGPPTPRRECHECSSTFWGRADKGKTPMRSDDEHRRHARSRSASRGRSPSPELVVEPWPVYATSGTHKTPEAVMSSPFYTLIEIPNDCLGEYGYELTRAEREDILIQFHAAHPVPRQCLRVLIRLAHNTDKLRFVGEWVDERLFEMTRLDEMAENMLETVHRINEILAQRGEETIGCVCRHVERLSLKEMEVAEEKDEAGDAVDGEA